MPDAWEILQSKSSGTGDAWDLLANITGEGGTITHAYEAGTFAITEAGAEFDAGADAITFGITENGSVAFTTDSQQIEFIGTDTIEVQP